MHKYELGNQSEAIVLAAYLKAGFTVSIPFGSGASYDLVVDSGNRFYKIQVKTGWLSKGCVCYKSLRRQSNRLTRRKYVNGEVDFFAVYCPSLEKIYVIPAANHVSEGRLRIENVKNGQEKLIRWASDYSWEQHIEELIRPIGVEPMTSTSGVLRSIH